ncbi:SDR family oxidoreductase [bacterium]|nr:SDR family oxidoreductase [bacterium]
MSEVVLITGASTGIGKAAALHFHQRGWKVAATMRRPELCDWAPRDERFFPVALDVTDTQSIQAALAQVLERWGGLEVLINNAGYGLVGPFEGTDPEQVRRQFETNVFGLMNVTRAVLPHFRQKRSGRILNVSSVGGRVTFPLYSCYHSTKWAVEGFSESLQFELKPFNIKVKLIEPGAIKTEFYDRSQDRVEAPDYQPFYDKTMERLQQAGYNAPGPELVAQTLWQAATDNSWKMRYPVNSADVLWFRKLAPEGFFRAFIGWYLMRK